jgi:hypothetical protein
MHLIVLERSRYQEQYRYQNISGGSAQTMAKTWMNVTCEFFTGNTANGLGNSKYLVLPNRMTRTAFVNFKRAPAQVCASNPSICYLDRQGESIIMKTPDDQNIRIDDVVADEITVGVRDAKTGAWSSFKCSRKPREGLSTFDFKNDKGVLTAIHVGHEVRQLTVGLPRRKSIG